MNSDNNIKNQKDIGKNSPDFTWVGALAAIIVSACWGGNFAASKFSLLDFSPFLTVLLRFVLVSALLLPFVIGKEIPRLRDMLVLSVLYVALHFSLIFYAMSHGLNITSAIIATQMGVPFSCLLSAIFFNDRLGPWRSFGLLVSFAGLLVISGTHNVVEHWQPFMTAMLGALAWSFANIYMKKMKPCGVIPMLFWPGLFALPQMAALTLLLEQNQLWAMAHAAPSAWLGIIYSAVFSSLVGYGLWLWLLKRYQMSQVVPYSLLTPVVGIACGVLIFGNPLSQLVKIGTALTIVGVAIITIRRPKLAELERI